MVFALKMKNKTIKTMHGQKRCIRQINHSSSNTISSSAISR